MRQHVLSALSLVAHGVVCVLGVAIVPTLLYIRIGYRQVHYSDFVLAKA